MDVLPVDVLERANELVPVAVAALVPHQRSGNAEDDRVLCDPERASFVATCVLRGWIGPERGSHSHRRTHRERTANEIRGPSDEAGAVAIESALVCRGRRPDQSVVGLQ